MLYSLTIGDERVGRFFFYQGIGGGGEIKKTNLQRLSLDFPLKFTWSIDPSFHKFPPKPSSPRDSHMCTQLTASSVKFHIRSHPSDPVWSEIFSVSVSDNHGKCGLGCHLGNMFCSRNTRKV